MGKIFHDFLVEPLLNILVYIYNYIPDIGVAIILLTVLVRLILLPSFHKSLKHQRDIQKLQPKMKEIKEKYKDDQQQQAAAMMELYKVHKVNPLSSCLPILIQLPLLFALYRVFIQSLNGQQVQDIYSFINNPGMIDPMFMGTVDLAAKGNYWMAAIAAVLQFFQTRMYQQGRAKDAAVNTGNEDAMEATNRMMMNYMMYFLPAITFFFGIQFPAVLSLYWITTTLFGIGQQYYILRKEAKEALHVQP